MNNRKNRRECQSPHKLRRVVTLFCLLGFMDVMWSDSAVKKNPSWDTLKIKAVGDMVPGTLYPDNRTSLNPYEDFFAPLQTHLSDSDILFANLETTLTHHSKTAKDTSRSLVFAFRTPPTMAEILKKVGFNVLSIANNHSLDFGEKGFADTARYLRSAGLLAVGAKGQIAYQFFKKKKIAFIAFSTMRLHNRITELDTMRGLVKEARVNADIVIVSCHWGGEGEKFLHTKNVTEVFYGENRGNLPQFAHAAIHAGADLILGHGPHVLRAMELYKNKLIVYSLGNFLGFGALSSRGKTGLSAIVEVELKENGDFSVGRIIPLYMPEKSIPRFDPGGQSIQLIQKLSREDFPQSQLNIADNGDLDLL